jgi:hypothetical protein
MKSPSNIAAKESGRERRAALKQRPALKWELAQNAGAGDSYSLLLAPFKFGEVFKTTASGWWVWTEKDGVAWHRAASEDAAKAALLAAVRWRWG